VAFCWSFRAVLKKLLYKCGVCPKVFSQTHLVATHIKEAHSDLFPCRLCPRLFKSSSEVAEHIAQAHSSADAQPRAQALKAKVTPAQLKKLLASSRKHIIVSQKNILGPLACSEEGCQYTTRSIHFLRRHRLNVHNISASYLCTMCGAGFASAEKLREHAEQHKSDDGYSIRCLKAGCKKLFSTATGLARHLETGHENQVLTKLGRRNCSCSLRKIALKLLIGHIS
jgi:uncharacterized C2H2 Zn-finger protein/DNA-directed RNA polymerase subunit RPC12/RpoP